MHANFNQLQRPQTEPKISIGIRSLILSAFRALATSPVVLLGQVGAVQRILVVGLLRSAAINRLSVVHRLI